MVQLIIMGVSGSGKTTVAKAMSDQFHMSYIEADDFHPASNIQKMTDGIPLTEEDREPWLWHLNNQLKSYQDHGKSCILACSALTRKARAILRTDIQKPVFIFLSCDKATIRDRLHQRRNHFMPASLLDSQFKTLEPPKEAITIKADQTPDTIMQQIKNVLDLPVK